MTDTRELAARFAHALHGGEADSAHAMLSGALGQSVTSGDLSEEFGALADDMGGVTGIGEPMVILEDWPDKAETDLAVVYVPLEGDMFSEAVTVTVARGNDGLVISNVEWGRP